jgi:hypothetical protein
MRSPTSANIEQDIDVSEHQSLPRFFDFTRLRLRQFCLGAALFGNRVLVTKLGAGSFVLLALAGKLGLKLAHPSGEGTVSTVTVSGFGNVGLVTEFAFAVSPLLFGGRHRPLADWWSADPAH